MIPTIDQVCAKALSLPCSPVLLPRMITVLSRDDTAVFELEAVIRLDPSLAASTLRLANSAYFAAGHSRVDNLEEAIQRLGQREIYRMAALALTGRWMNIPVNGYRWEPGDFCRYSLIVGLAAEYLAQKSGLVDPSTAYTAGLVSEIGKLALAYSCGEHFEAIRLRQCEGKLTWIAAEQAVLGYSYATVGAMLLKRWNFPANLVAVAVHNPPFATAPSEVLPLLAHVHAAKYIATSIGAGVSEDGFLFALNSELLLKCGFTAGDLEAAMPEVVTRGERMLPEKVKQGTLSF